ncbi:Ubiquitin-activating enzyme E1 2 [Forsythia ovata]|uniref:Ubiquitin-activating enzyme E1 2 n=1 Tax=Forsythia ovata TaxID=205694 RepID=A0ABD1UY07_9LAMI
MVIPHLTENYGASRDPPERETPMCIVQSFPHNIDHCLTWASSEFEGLFEKTPAEVNTYLSSPSDYISAMKNSGDAQARDNLERVLKCIDRDKWDSFEDCITWARFNFENYFVNRVKQLTFTFPEDTVTSSGVPFWSAPKRFPHPLEFSIDDLSHLHFVMAASILQAEAFGIPIPDWVKSRKKKKMWSGWPVGPVVQNQAGLAQQFISPSKIGPGPARPGFMYGPSISGWARPGSPFAGSN